MKQFLACLSGILACGIVSLQAAPTHGSHTYIDGTHVSWYSQGNARVDVVTDRAGRLQKFVVSVKKFETGPNGKKRLVGFETVTLVPLRKAVYPAGVLQKTVNAFLANPALVISAATVPRVPNPSPTLAEVLRPTGCHISRRTIGTRAARGTRFHMTTIVYDAAGNVVRRMQTTAPGVPPGLGLPGGAGLAGGRTVRPPHWPPVHVPVYVSGSF